jgi:hypothetical protein
MAAASPRAIFSGSSLVRLLANLDLADGLPPDADPGHGAQPNDAERLGSWLDWTDAIALSAVLNQGGSDRSLAVRGQAAPQTTAVAATVEACQRVRDDLVKLATADVGYTAGTRSARPLDFSSYRSDYQAHQRAMEAAIGPLRERVRAALSDQTPSMARLAALDAVMDQALRPRERQLLAALPGRLEKHVERLQLAAGSVAFSAPDTVALHQRCHREMHRLLLAELDFRLEPVEGMVEALRDATPPAP